VIDLGKKLGRSPAMLADALYELISAGVDAENAISVLEAATQASLACFNSMSAAS
jgi:hypothetical protein